ncbi:hypothetical protein MJH12_06215 [bacterium]|nr:hypothetical protein [bacterium]
MILKTKTYKLPCHHQLISNQLSHEQNEEVFSKCMGLYGHGHEYLLRSSFLLATDNFELERQVDLHVKEQLLDTFSHQSLNIVFQEMGIENPVTTGEQIVLIFADLLSKDLLSKNYYRIELVETPKNSFYHFFNK